MYIIILFAAIGIIYNIRSQYNDYGFEWLDFTSYIIAIISGFGMAILGLSVALVFPVKYKTDKWSTELESLKDNNSVSGSFFLGSGQINGQMRYVYYVKEDSNSFKMYQVDYYDATISYTDKRPTIYIVSTYRDEDALQNKFAIDLFSDNKWSCVFNIPKGSIKADFQLDAQ